MDKDFKIKITDEETGKSDILILDVRCPVDIQLSIGVFGKVIMQPPGTLEGTSDLLFIASKEHDYEAKTLHKIVKAVALVFGGNLIWELSPDRPKGESESDIRAYLTLNTKRYSIGGE
ncbi:hypothetical protein [Alistipes sp.]|uniref:hypothetical protein n=1 Tax=Alistipes sp. TaxID=1872444 RepID=UPI003AB19014